MYLAPRLRSAARVIRAGGVVAYPTESVYGLGCRPDHGLAVARLLDLKGRRQTEGLILIAADRQQLDGWIAPGSAENRRLLAPTDRAVTWVVTAGPLAATWITGGRPTVAVRLVRHPLAAALCRAAGMALVSTSANPHGRPPARSAGVLRRYFPTGIDCVVRGATGGARRPSEIRDASSGHVLRKG